MTFDPNTLYRAVVMEAVHEDDCPPGCEVEHWCPTGEYEPITDQELVIEARRRGYFVLGRAH